MDKNNLRISEPNRARGQALVEFIVVLTFIFIPLAVLTFDMGLLLMTYHKLQHGTREGAKVVGEYPFIEYHDPRIFGLPSAACQISPGQSSRCALATLADPCCVATLRTATVLVRSGINDMTVTGTWQASADGGTEYLFLNLEATVVRRLFFGLAPVTLNVSSTGYADEF